MATFRRAFSFFGWTRHSSIVLGGFLLTIFLILYIWWPLAEEVLSYIDWNGPWWLYMDWLLIGIFLFMSLTIIARADLRYRRIDRLGRMSLVDLQLNPGARRPTCGIITPPNDRPYGSYRPGRSRRFRLTG